MFVVPNNPWQRKVKSPKLENVHPAFYLKANTQIKDMTQSNSCLIVEHYSFVKHALKDKLNYGKKWHIFYILSRGKKKMMESPWNIH